MSGTRTVNIPTKAKALEIVRMFSDLAVQMPEDGDSHENRLAFATLLMMGYYQTGYVNGTILLPDWFNGLD